MMFDDANVKNEGTVTFVVDIAGNAADALSCVSASPSRYSLILLDMMLPDTHGYDESPIASEPFALQIFQSNSAHCMLRVYM